MIQAGLLGEWRAVEIALENVAAQLDERATLRSGLHKFGHYLHVQQAAQAVIVRITSAVVPLVCTARVSEPSSLIEDTGKRCMYSRDECPMPKSSIDRRTPASASCLSVSSTTWPSGISADSVISSSISTGSSPCMRSAFLTRAGRSGSVSWIGDRLMAIVSCRWPAAFQRALHAQASLITQAPTR